MAHSRLSYLVEDARTAVAQLVPLTLDEVRTVLALAGFDRTGVSATDGKDEKFERRDTSGNLRARVIVVPHPYGNHDIRIYRFAPGNSTAVGHASLPLNTAAREMVYEIIYAAEAWERGEEYAREQDRDSSRTRST